MSNANNIGGTIAEAIAIVNTKAITNIGTNGTFTLDDANIAASQNITNINTLFNALTPLVTATISSTKANIININVDENEAAEQKNNLTITVSDAVTVEESGNIRGKTALTANNKVNFSNGLSDTFNNFRASSAALNANTNAMMIDTDLAVTVTDTVNLTTDNAASAFAALVAKVNGSGDLTSTVSGGLTKIETALGSLQTGSSVTTIITDAITTYELDLLVNILQASVLVTADIQGSEFTFAQLYTGGAAGSGSEALSQFTGNDSPQTNEITLLSAVSDYNESSQEVHWIQYLPVLQTNHLIQPGRMD